MHALVKTPQDKAVEYASLGHERLVAGDLDNAASLLAAALDEDPDCVPAVINLGVVHGQRFQWRVATALMQRAVMIAPGEAPAWSNLGLHLTHLQRFDEAEAALERAVAIDPNHPATRLNLGLLRYNQERPDDAVAELKLAVRLFDEAGTPSLQAKSDLSLSTMKAGRFHEGLVLNECRWDGMLAKSAAWQCGARRWEGESLSYQTILVHSEQGHGDAIQFCRFLPELKSKYGAAKVIFAVPKLLVRLFAGQCGADEVIDIDNVGDLVAASRKSDYHSPLLSVVRVLGTEFQGLPPKAPPYLHPTVAPLAAGRRPQVRGAGLRVGIVWSASPGYERSRERSVPVEDLLALAEVPGVRLYSLQVGPYAVDLARAGADKLVVDLTSQIKDFADTADLMEQLDLVVSVDTAAIHLAGALGRPVWLIQPICTCWRWATGAKVWYGSAEEYHQVRAGSWAEPIAEMKRDLARLVS